MNAFVIYTLSDFLLQFKQFPQKLPTQPTIIIAMHCSVCGTLSFIHFIDALFHRPQHLLRQIRFNLCHSTCNGHLFTLYLYTMPYYTASWMAVENVRRTSTNLQLLHIYKYTCASVKRLRAILWTLRLWQTAHIQLMLQGRWSTVECVCVCCECIPSFMSSSYYVHTHRV